MNARLGVRHMAGSPKNWPSKLDFRASSRWITLGSLAGLVLGLAFGVLIHSTGRFHLQALTLLLEPFAALWLRVLRLIVVPLIVCVLVASIASKGSAQKLGRMGGLTFACFLSILFLGALFSFTAAFVLVRGFAIDARALASLHANVANTASPGAAIALSPWQWIRGLVSSKLLKAMAAGHILPVLGVTILFALLLRSFAPRYRDPVVSVFHGAGEAITVAVRLLFCGLPVVVFILVASVSSRTGVMIARGVGYYLLATCGTLLAFTGVQYFIAWLVGGISVGLFARGVLPAQACAVTTRSSLASLPALLEGANDRLALPPAVAAFVLPLSVSTFKASQSIFAPLKLIFLAHLFGVSLDPASLAAFAIGVFILSFVTPGVPSVGSVNTIPLLLALGIPLQGIILLNTVAEISDFFETLLNVTADMAVATIVTRFRGAAMAVADAESSPTALLMGAAKSGN